MTPHQELIKYLRLCRKMQPKIPGYYYFSAEDFVLKNGQGYTPNKLPDKYEYGPWKECFRNAANLALDNPNLTYVEGFAISIIPVWHGWCVTKNGMVIDNTWRHDQHPPLAYYGVPLSTELLRHYLLWSEVYGILYTRENLLLKNKYDPKEALRIIQSRL